LNKFAEHRRRLRFHRSDIIDLLVTGHGLLDHLFEQRVISHREMADIRAIHDKAVRNAELLDVLLAKPRDCYERFIAALTATEQKSLVELLQLGGGELTLDLLLERPRCWQICLR
jgi:hypothetical protein